MPQQNFKIIIPMYNVDKWITGCIDSVLRQSYKNYHVIMIDDNSSDKTCETAVNFLKAYPTEERSRFKYFKRSINVGALENIVFGISAISNDPNDVIVLLDGDDRLADNNVLEKLNAIYNNGNIFMTYGSYKNISNGARGLCSQLSCFTNDYRKSNTWCTSHLRTMKKFLWDRIDNRDLRNEFGKYYSMSWDLAIMFPLLEMSGNERAKYIEDILYDYNDLNDLNDHKKNVSLQLSLAQEIRRKSVYNKI